MVSKKKGNTTLQDVPSEVKIALTRSVADNTLMHITCLVFLVLITYANTLNAPFQWDERHFLVNNPIVKNLHYFSNPSDAKDFELYGALINRYAGYLTFALDYKMHGMSVTGYHIVNIAIHILNSILVYFFVLLTFRTPFFSRLTTRDDLPAPPLIALFSALLFAVHPLQTEAVTYVFQRFACLVAFFYLLSLAAYIKSRLSEGRRQRIFYYGISLISAILAMKTKENAFTLPLIIALYEVCFLRGSARKRLLHLTPLLLTLLIIPLSLMSLTGSHQLDPGSYGAREFSRTDYFFTQFRVIVTYLRLLFFPVNQNINYDYPVYTSFFAPPVLLSSIFLAALFGLGIYLLQRARGIEQAGDKEQDDPRSALVAMRLIGFGILWFFITLSVESSIIPISMIIDEYRVYLPSVGLIISMVIGVLLLAKRVKAKAALLSVVFVLAAGSLSVGTYMRNELWADGVKLWEDTARKSPAKAPVQYHLGTIYQNLDMFDKAVEQYLLAIRLDSSYIDAHNNLGNVYQTLNMFDKAIGQYLLAIKLDPYYVDAYNNLGLVYCKQGRTQECTNEINAAYAIEHYNKGKAYAEHGPIEDGIAEFQTAIRLKPDFADAHINLGILYYKAGQIENASRELETGLNITPDNLQAQQLLKKLPR